MVASHLQVLSSRLSSPFIASLGLGLAANSFFLYGNLGASIFGIMPSLHNVDSHTALRLNSWFYDKAKGPFFGCALVSGVGYLTAAYKDPGLGLGTPLVVAALAILAVGPYTVLAMKPVNDAIKAKVIAKQGQNESEDRRLLASWTARHVPRMVLSAVSLALASATLLVAL